MANSAADEAGDYNSEIITEFRANQGRVGGMWEGTTLILLHHVGAKSGVERVTPVACSPQPAGSRSAPPTADRPPPELVLQPQGPPPDHRRGRHPDVHGPGEGTGRHRPRRAVTQAGRRVAQAGRGVPDLGAAQARTTRQFPVFLLTRQD